MLIARGNVRCGSFASPAENVTYCQPSYAHSTPIIATPKPAAREPLGASMGVVGSPAPPLPRSVSTTLRRNSTPNLAPVVQFCTVALPRVPRMLISATTAITTTEITGPGTWNGSSGDR